MNLLKYFEGHAIKADRAVTDDLKTMIELQRRELLREEERLKARMDEGRALLKRTAVARALGLKEPDL